MNNTIRGKIKKVIYKDREENFSIFKFQTDNGDKVTAKGSLSSPKVGDKYHLEGDFFFHDEYGLQFKIKFFSKIISSDKQEVLDFLTTISGITNKAAHKIIEKLKKDCLKTIKKEPEILDEFNFLAEKQKDKIVSELLKHQKKKEFFLELEDLHFSEYMLDKIWLHYYSAKKLDTRKILSAVKKNPYQLIKEIDGISFQKADEFALTLGFDRDDNKRIKAGILESLSKSQNNGHVYLPESELLSETNNLLRIQLSKDTIDENLTDLVDNNEVVIKNKKVYLYDLYHAEKEIAYNIKNLLKSDHHDFDEISSDEIDDLIQKEEQKFKAEIPDFEFTDKQKEAIKKALNNNISIITGNPGTGKSKIIKAICDIYKNQNPNKKIHLASPTGKAANRMEELTGYEAKTIHRLLSYDGSFNHNTTLNPGKVTLDEFSMTDIRLAYHLFSAIDSNVKVIIVGDTNQLPSIGPGNVLKDMIESKIVPVTRLKKNFRQSKNGRIITMAKKISEGEVPELQVNGSDFEYVSADSEHYVINYIRNFFDNPPEEVDTFDIQVITPVNKGNVGVENFNKIIQNIVNPKTSKTLKKYRLNDKIMILENNYEKEVFNGETGKIIEIEDDKLTIKLSHTNKWVDYHKDELDEIGLGYACTVHKSQGSEFPYVLMVMLNSHSVMLQRNLLYTGITRAQKQLIFLSEEKAFQEAIKNNKTEKRHTSLDEYLNFKKTVTLNNEVTLEDENSEETITYTIVTPDNTDLSENKISNKSPLGKKVINREIGDVIEVPTQTPTQTAIIPYKIKK